MTKFQLIDSEMHTQATGRKSVPCDTHQYTVQYTVQDTVHDTIHGIGYSTRCSTRYNTRCSTRCSTLYNTRCSTRYRCSPWLSDLLWPLEGSISSGGGNGSNNIDMIVDMRMLCRRVHDTISKFVINWDWRELHEYRNTFQYKIPISFQELAKYQQWSCEPQKSIKNGSLIFIM